MGMRLKVLLIVGMLFLLSLTLAACERERPPVTTVPTSTTAPRGTVAPSPTPPAAATLVTLPGITGAQPTVTTAAAATPTAPAPQQVVVSPGGSTGTSGPHFTYTVQAGDTLAGIATRYNVTQEALVTLNALTNPDALTIGQQLKIPGTASTGAEATVTAGGTSVYVVQSGDTLAAIARRFGTTVAELVQLNNLANPDRIAVGQKLTVPTTGGAVAPATGSMSGQRRTHIVASGETLLSIARAYGVTVQAIQSANNIANPDRIFPGQVLVIP